MEDQLTWVPRTEIHRQKERKKGPREIGRIDYNPDELTRSTSNRSKNKSPRKKAKGQSNSKKSRVFLPEKFRNDSSMKSTLPKVKVHKAGPREIGTIDYNPKSTKKGKKGSSKRKKKNISSPDARQMKPHRISLPPMKVDRNTKKISLTPMSEFIAENDAYTPNSAHSAQSSSISTHSHADTEPNMSPFTPMSSAFYTLEQMLQPTINEGATLGISTTPIDMQGNGGRYRADTGASMATVITKDSATPTPTLGSKRDYDEIFVMDMVDEEEEEDDKSVDYIATNDNILSQHKAKTVPMFEDSDHDENDHGSVLAPFIVDDTTLNKPPMTNLQNTLSGGSIGALFMDNNVILEDSDMDEVESIGRQNSIGRGHHAVMPGMVASHSYGKELSPKDAKIMNFIIEDHISNEDDELVDISYDKNRSKSPKKGSQRSISLFAISSTAKKKLKQNEIQINTTAGANMTATPKSPDTPTPNNDKNNGHLKSAVKKAHGRTSSNKLLKKRKNKVWKGNTRNPTL